MSATKLSNDELVGILGDTPLARQAKAEKLETLLAHRKDAVAGIAAVEHERQEHIGELQEKCKAAEQEVARVRKSLEVAEATWRKVSTDRANLNTRCDLARDKHVNELILTADSSLDDFINELRAEFQRARIDAPSIQEIPGKVDPFSEKRQSRAVGNIDSVHSCLASITETIQAVQDYKLTVEAGDPVRVDAWITEKRADIPSIAPSVTTPVTGLGL